MKIYLHTNYINFVLLFKCIYLIFCINLVIYYNYLLVENPMYSLLQNSYVFPCTVSVYLIIIY